MKAARACVKELRGIRQPSSGEENDRAWDTAEDTITKHIAIAVREKDSEISELKDHCNLVWQLFKPFIPVCPASTRKLLDKAMEDSKKLRGEGSHRLAELSAKCQELDSRCYKESIKRLEAEARLERARTALGKIENEVDLLQADESQGNLESMLERIGAIAKAKGENQ